MFRVFAKEEEKKFVVEARKEILLLVTNNRSIGVRKCQKHKECAV